MNFFLASCLAFFSSALFAQSLAVARLSDITIPARGSIVFKQREKLKASFDGRVETVNAQEQTWVKAGQALAYLADIKTAALLDYRGMTPKQAVLDRWKSVYSLMKVSCPQDCLILHRFVSEGQRIKTGDPLFQVAYRVALFGKIPPEYARYVKDGQDLFFWPASNALKKKKTMIQNYSLDQTTAPPMGVFTSFIPVRHYPQELQWVGRITLAHDVVAVPTSSLISYQGKVFLPMEVVSGITTKELTEIKASEAVTDHSPVLILKDVELNKAFRYDPKHALSLMPTISTAPAVSRSLPAARSATQAESPPKKPKGPSFWERLKAVKPLPSRNQQRQSDSEEDYGD